MFILVVPQELTRSAWLEDKHLFELDISSLQTELIIAAKSETTGLPLYGPVNERPKQ